MLGQILAWEFGLQLLVAAAVLAAIWVASWWYNKEGTHRIPTEFFRGPTSNALTILGLLIPVLIALLTYLFTNTPGASFTFLASSIVLLVATLFIAIWETFALISKGSDDGKIISLTYPEDRGFVTALGWMYALLVVGIVYVCAFLVFELSPSGVVSSESKSDGDLFIRHSHLAVRTTHADVKSSWGKPQTTEGPNTWVYETPASVIRLDFDSAGTVANIREVRKD